MLTGGTAEVDENVSRFVSSAACCSVSRRPSLFRVNWGQRRYFMLLWRSNSQEVNLRSQERCLTSCYLLRAPPLSSSFTCPPAPLILVFSSSSHLVLVLYPPVMSHGDGAEKKEVWGRRTPLSPLFSSAPPCHLVLSYKVTETKTEMCSQRWQALLFLLPFISFSAPPIKGKEGGVTVRTSHLFISSSPPGSVFLIWKHHHSPPPPPPHINKITSWIRKQRQC